MSIKPLPFVSGAKRFKADEVTDVPGPGEYEINDSIKKHKSFSLIKSGFNVCASRFSKTRPDQTPGNRLFKFLPHLLFVVKRS